VKIFHLKKSAGDDSGKKHSTAHLRSAGTAGRLRNTGRPAAPSEKPEGADSGSKKTGTPVFKNF
jgi:hypothetical protein